MITIREIFDTFKKTLQLLYEYQEVEALTLIAAVDVTGWSKAQIKAFPEKEVSNDEAEKLSVILARLQTGEPIQYILGHTEFYGLPLYVNPSVLIPRPETEELVEWALSEVESQKSKVRVLDIGTGSGCIAISLKRYLPNASVTAIDISAGALITAKQNADLNEVKINFIHADILNIHKSEIEHLKFEIIISNPPYVTPLDKTRMHTNVVGFEPHTALFVPENDPLLFYNAIADFALKNMETHGLLFLEINESLGNETVDLLKNKGFKNIRLKKDMAGKDRMVKAGK